MAKKLAMLLVGLAFTPSGQEPTHPPEFHSSCILTREVVDLEFNESDELDELLSRHSAAHGWSLELDGPDMVGQFSAAKCPPLVLDGMEGAGNQLGNRGPENLFLVRQLALALERNGRVDGALRLVTEVIGGVRNQHGYFLQEMYLSSLSESKARIAAHAGRWEVALASAEGWSVASLCGYGASNEEARVRLFRARCLLRLNRYSEVERLVMSTMSDPSLRDTSLIEVWIDSEIASGHSSTAEDACSYIISQSPVDGADACASALTIWRLVHGSRIEQITHLGELSASHPDLAFSLLLSLDQGEAARQLWALDISSGRFRNKWLALLLAQTGSPEVGSVLDRIQAECDDLERPHELEFVMQTWNSSHRRWRALTEWRR